MSRSALVTGASRGIGLGIARMLAELGYAVTATARDPDRLAAVAAELGELGAPDVVVVPGDLADPDLPAAIVAAHAAAFGTMDCLVLNAGVGTAGPVADYPLHRLDKTVAVNLRAPFAILRESVPLLRAAAADGPGSRVVAIASITGVYAEPGLAAYGATKAAVLSLVDTLNAEESRNGVSATAIAPGYVDTEMSSWMQLPQDELIPVEDVVALVRTAAGLSRRSVVSRIVVSRVGADGLRA